MCHFLTLQFFLKATQLENVKADYVRANESRWMAQEILSQREKVGQSEIITIVGGEESRIEFFFLDEERYIIYIFISYTAFRYRHILQITQINSNSTEKI